LDWLGSDQLTWRDLKVIVRQSQADSALARAMNPDVHWGISELLLAEAVDTLHWLQWAKTKDAQYKRNMPKPVPRPGVDTSQYEVIGEAMEMDDLDRALGWAV
jgi:hypothetical protein